MNTCNTCALKRTCQPLFNLNPLHKSLALAKENAFPPPCGGSLYQRQQPRQGRMRAFEQYKQPQPEAEKPVLPKVRTLDDLEPWGEKQP